MDRGNAMVVGMIDFGTCAIENLQPCSESYIDGICAIFKKEKAQTTRDIIQYIKE